MVQSIQKLIMFSKVVLFLILLPANEMEAVELKTISSNDTTTEEHYNLTDIVIIKLEPSSIIKTETNKLGHFKIKLNCNSGHQNKTDCLSLKRSKGRIYMKINSKNVIFTLQNKNATKQFTASIWDDEEENNFVSFSTFGRSNQRHVRFTPSALGIYELTFFMSDGGSYPYQDTNINNKLASLKIVVSGSTTEEMLTKILTIAIAVVLGIGFFLMGIDLNKSVIWSSIKRPTGPAIGVLCQFGFMPLCAFGLSKLFLVQSHEVLGFILVGACPGGAASNCFTTLFNGDIDLSVTMTVVSTMASFGMTTFWAWLLGKNLLMGVEGAKDPTQQMIPIPYKNIGIALLGLCVPLCFGIAFKHKCTEKSSIIAKYVTKPYYILALLCGSALYLYTSQSMFHLMTWKHFVCGALLSFLGLTFGTAFAAVCKQSKPQIIAIAFETSLQNSNLAIVILNLTFDSPYYDMAMLPVLAYVYSIFPIIFSSLAFYLGYQCKKANWSLEDLRKKRAQRLPTEIEMMDRSQNLQGTGTGNPFT